MQPRSVFNYRWIRITIASFGDVNQARVRWNFRQRYEVLWHDVPKEVRPLGVNSLRGKVSPIALPGHKSVDFVRLLFVGEKIGPADLYFELMNEARRRNTHHVGFPTTNTAVRHNELVSFTKAETIKSVLDCLFRPAHISRSFTKSSTASQIHDGSGSTPQFSHARRCRSKPRSISARCVSDSPRYRLRARTWYGFDRSKKVDSIKPSIISYVCRHTLQL
jgi:hypothetical protein